MSEPDWSLLCPWCSKPSGLVLGDMDDPPNPPPPCQHCGEVSELELDFDDRGDDEGEVSSWSLVKPRNP